MSSESSAASSSGREVSGEGPMISRPDSPAAQDQDRTIHSEHVFSLFGPWCYICGVRKRWWKFWQSWTEDDHDEPF